MRFRSPKIWISVSVGLSALLTFAAVSGVHGQADPRRTNELSAVKVLREIGSAQMAYAQACGHGKFATSYKALTGAGAKGPFLDPQFSESASPTISHYRFSLEPARESAPGPSDCNGRPTTSGYYAGATPVTFGHDGGWSFALSTDGLIWRVSSAKAPKEPFGAPAEIIK